MNTDPKLTPEKKEETIKITLPESSQSENPLLEEAKELRQWEILRFFPHISPEVPPENTEHSTEIMEANPSTNAKRVHEEEANDKNSHKRSRT